MAADEEAFILFRRFLALKIGAPLVLDHGLHGLPAVSWASLGAAGAICVASARTGCWPGLLVLLAFQGAGVWRSWPFTINHEFLEAVIVLLMLLDPREEGGSPRVSAASMIKLLMLSVWFYSGLQKLVHGYVWSGEYFALATLTRDGGLGRNLEALLRLVESRLGTATFAPIQCCLDGRIHLPAWEMRLFQAMGVSTITAELLLPLGVLVGRLERASIYLLLALQLAIALLSLEIDFAFTAFAVLFLFVPGRARLAYGGLAVAYLLWMR
jgi:hypothetical protein